MTTSSVQERIAVVGGGSIGVGWSVVFATAGHEVSLYEPDSNRADNCVNEFYEICEALSNEGLSKLSADRAYGYLTLHSNLEESLQNKTYVQECAPEDEALKQQLFAQLAKYTTESTVLASSSSTIPVSRIAGDANWSKRSLLVHPLNPPYLLRVAELLPTPNAHRNVLDRAKRLMTRSGIDPIVLNTEIEGFLFNRLQGALLREAYCLVRDGIASVEQIDKAVSRGLGVRWSVLGVFETVDLNTRGGIEHHAKTLGPAYLRMGKERGQSDAWTDDLIATVVKARRNTLPLEQWKERVKWRDKRLIDIARLRAGPNWK